MRPACIDLATLQEEYVLCDILVFFGRWSGRGFILSFQNHSKAMVSRMTLVVYLLEARACVWLYEQPMTSLLWQHPRMQDLVRRVLVYQTQMWMGSYGAESPKSTCLWSCCPCSSFSVPLPKDKTWISLVNKSAKSDGTISVSGNSKLKGSQAYPAGFGHATVDFWKNAPRVPKAGVAETPEVFKPGKKFDSWPDADLTEVLQYLACGNVS